MSKIETQPKHMRQHGFSLVEILLVIGFIIAGSIIAYIVGSKRTQALQSDTAISTLNQINKSIQSVSNTNLNYAILSTAPANAIPASLMGTGGQLKQSPWGDILVNTNSGSKPHDSFFVTFDKVPPYACVSIAAKGYDGFSSIEINGSVVWTTGTASPDPATLSDACKPSENTVKFTSKRLDGNFIPPIVPVVIITPTTPTTTPIPTGTPTTTTTTPATSTSCTGDLNRTTTAPCNSPYGGASISLTESASCTANVLGPITNTFTRSYWLTTTDLNMVANGSAVCNCELTAANNEAKTGTCPDGATSYNYMISYQCDYYGRAKAFSDESSTRASTCPILSCNAATKPADTSDVSGIPNCQLNTTSHCDTSTGAWVQDRYLVGSCSLTYPAPAISSTCSGTVSTAETFICPIDSSQIFKVTTTAACADGKVIQVNTTTGSCYTP